MAQFSERIKGLRKARDLTQKQMAEILSITVRNYQYYESGEREPNFETLRDIAGKLHVSIDYLSGKEDDTAKCVYVDGKPVHIDLEKFRYDLALIYAQSKFKASEQPKQVDGVPLSEYMTMVSDLDELILLFGNAYRELSLIGERGWIFKMGLADKLSLNGETTEQ